ncbi:MAG: lamin tail domain-containing protein [Bacteroidota bacterium]|nr:lamin tail domain-containing protein [Bacteroidota bacterium]
MSKTKLLLLALLASMVSVAQTANRHDVVITEIMADPTPVVGLPNAEYLEIKNISATAFNISGWKISDATSTATISASFLLQPDSILILCANSNVASFSVFGKTIGVTSFPSLNNDGDVLTLRSPQNKVVHTVPYTSEWYGNAAKKNGGWSLEMIDTKNPCGGKENWKASVSNLGGTPGKINSVNGANPDTTPPRLLRTYTTDSVTINLVYNEPLDSASGATLINYSLSGIKITAASTIAPRFQIVQLKLATPLLPSTLYNITVSNVTDCKGNAIGAYNKAKIGVPQNAAPQDVVVNEILYNPKTPGSDYVEFYNKSKKVVDASKLYIANRSSAGAVASLKKISEDPFYIFPGDYIVVTADAAILKMQYLVKNEDALLQLSSLPSYPDNKGTVVLIDINGTIVDEVAYEDNWQFALINNVDGVALERIDPSGNSNDKNNWHSAASTAGFGTPTYKNSQYKLIDPINATIEVLPKIFSPDNDGTDDVTTIYYKVEASGYVANVTIFDASGRTVKYLVRNALLGVKGSWNWDGLGEKNNKLPIGTYIVYTEIFNLQGKKKSFTNTVVLARKLN